MLALQGIDIKKIRASGANDILSQHQMADFAGNARLVYNAFQGQAFAISFQSHIQAVTKLD